MQGVGYGKTGNFISMYAFPKAYYKENHSKPVVLQREVEIVEAFVKYVSKLPGWVNAQRIAMIKRHPLPEGGNSRHLRRDPPADLLIGGPPCQAAALKRCA
ncbi:hypothetical protein [Streptomyces sp. bgisy082]|uniref:hypothetical protein n=1 Tax=Streptomyces sp. bgisy082 TaxID=3413776 RepID=UPI003D725485